MPPNSAVSALCTSASASARQISVSTPCGLSRCAALAIQRGNRPGAAVCASRRPGSGDTFCRVASRNGGFISTRSAAPGLLPRWIASAAHLLKPQGVLSLIWRADALAEVQSALTAEFGGIAVLPVYPHPDAHAN